jgi:S1-C subfamily serine protease
MVRPPRARLLLGLAGVVLALIGVWALSSFEIRPRKAQATARQVDPAGSLRPGEQATIALFEQARASVVYITTQGRVVDLWTRNAFNVPRGSGSGFVWDDRGHLVTNHHVVAGAAGARVLLSDGRDAGARLVGVSPAHDLAVLRIDLPELPPPLKIGSSHDLKVGQSALAIGNPFGLDWTLTTGVVSALDRSLPTEDGRGLIEHVIQTDAAINPGNSGGPLLDSSGRLIGVNTMIFRPSGASAGVGFAVPVVTFNRVVAQLMATGRYMGRAPQPAGDRAARGARRRHPPGDAGFRGGKGGLARRPGRGRWQHRAGRRDPRSRRNGSRECRHAAQPAR